MVYFTQYSSEEESIQAVNHRRNCVNLHAYTKTLTTVRHFGTISVLCGRCGAFSAKAEKSDGAVRNGE